MADTFRGGGPLGMAARCEYDLCVIGGGVNGMATARDAALRGLRVIVLERRDVSSGTSAWSTRLIHGGLKYLEQLDLRLVLESIRERAELLRNAPHLVHPHPMLVPFYRGARRPAAVVRLGLAVHSLLAARGGLARSRSVRRRELDRRWPGLSRRELRGAALYQDAQVPWAERLGVEMAMDAVGSGAVLLTHTTVVGLQHTSTGVTVRAVDGAGRESTILARAVVNATGPWVDQVLDETTGGLLAGTSLIGGTKGSHVVVDPFPGAPPTCVFFEAQSDGRPMFVLPWARRYLIGTTDIDFEGDLDDLTASVSEIEYLTNEAARVFPGSNLTPADVLYSYAGVRPLPFAQSVDDNAKISRGHSIVWHGNDLPRVLSVVGGKLTTHRALAEDAVDAVLQMLGEPRRVCLTRGRRLPGAVGFERQSLRRDLMKTAMFAPAQVDRFLDIYGSRASTVARLVSADPRLREVIDDETGAVAAEVVLAVEHDGAATIADIVFRRTMVGYNGEVGSAAGTAVANVLGAVLRWSDERVATSLRAFDAERRRYRPRDR